MSKETGGPAFQNPEDAEFGMTLRDYFAAKAMQAYISDLDWRVDMSSEQTAISSYLMADAMLKERGQ